MSAALAAEPAQRPKRGRVAPEPRVVNKRELCLEAGITRPTLDARIASDPHFPVIRRGRANGDDWQFDAEKAVARLAELAPSRKGDLSPNQELLAIRVIREKRSLAEEAGALAVSEEVVISLTRGCTALRRGLTGRVVEKAAERMGLSREQQRLLRGLIEDELRAFVAGLSQTGLPDVGE